MKFDPGSGPTDDSSYPQGIEAIHERIEHARRPFVYMPEDLPAPDIALAPLKAQMIPDLGPYAGPHVRAPDFVGRRTILRHEFSGQSELAFLVATLIMMSRRVNFPPEMAALWHRIWREEAPFLIGALDTRWKISALRTFGSHGETEAERRLGHEVFLVTGMMKLADTERAFSGLAPKTTFKLGKRHFGPVSLGLEPFSVASGDLDLHMLNTLYEVILACEGRPSALLGTDILRRIDADERTVFRRLMTIRQKFLRARARKQAERGEG